MRSCAYFTANSHAPARQAKHLRANADAAFVQRLNRDLVALANFAQHVLLGHAAVFQDQLAGAGSANAQLVFFFADGEAGKVLLDDECGDAFVSSRGVDRGQQNKDARLPCRW